LFHLEAGGQLGAHGFHRVAAAGDRAVVPADGRVVEDGKFITSSGVSAGIDMTLALIARLCGIEQARQVARWAEYVWNENREDDPFARSEV
jgi:transcriptional regulator GlxA family with amidase domain